MFKVTNCDLQKDIHMTDKNNQDIILQGFVNDIKTIINTARTNAVRSVAFCRVQMYWAIGQRIVEKEQQGKERADYGTYLIKNLAKEIEPEYGSGFGVQVSGQAAGAILRKGLLERPQEDVSEPPYLLAFLIQEGRLSDHCLHASHECLHRRACALEVSPPLHRTPGVRNRQARCSPCRTLSKGDQAAAGSAEATRRMP